LALHAVTDQFWAGVLENWTENGQWSAVISDVLISSTVQSTDNIIILLITITLVGAVLKLLQK